MKAQYAAFLLEYCKTAHMEVFCEPDGDFLSNISVLLSVFSADLEGGCQKSLLFNCYIISYGSARIS